ncbi:MAG TPA: alpha-2-macroglobulin family protein, partial [Gemmataceae bacterium]|nr:alpha-2-macroglobulin family protein [Gemmataceae bacterium]
VYVQPRDDLKIKVQADKDMHRPGEEGRIQFQVTDAAGKPTAAALGILVVDEAVYALQDMQPGLEKVYFTLQEELLKPQAQAVYRPAETVPVLIQQPVLAAADQQVAQALFSAAKPKPPARWEEAPVLKRRQEVQGQVQQIVWGLYGYALNGGAFMNHDKKAKRWVFKEGLLDDVAKSGNVNAAALNGPFGKKWTLAELAKLEKGVTPEHLARAVTAYHMQNLVWVFNNYTNTHKDQWLKDAKWTFPKTVLADAAKAQNGAERWLKDGWGRPIRLVKRDKKWAHNMGLSQFDFHELVSAGPDGKFGTADDIKQSDPAVWNYAGWWWVSGRERLARLAHGRGRMLRGDGLREELAERQDLFFGAIDAEGVLPLRRMAVPDMADRPLQLGDVGGQKAKTGLGVPPGDSAAPVRVREYFPETMLWQPALITDEQGRAELPLTFADSITTWRLTASASSQGGSLGGVSAPLRVFQDFFVDIDLPVSLTQNDEVAFPVAVYNYLKSPQTVTLDLQREPWFELTDGGGLTRSLDLKPNEVTAVKFR